MALLNSGLGPYRRRTYPAPTWEFRAKDQKVGEVLDHAATLDDDGVAALLAEEKDGRNRSSVIKGLEGLLEGPETSQDAPDSTEDDE